ncbi:HAD-IIB family hydrolase [Erysipelothrix sp. HDW6C]|nr:HAD-IIB family hydrolase [Erysipelothrix sp. HDW6C]
MKNSEIFYFDVDGTLLDNKTHTFPQSTLDALNSLKQRGYKIALCTGRSLLGAHEVGVVDMLDWDGYVLANGSLVLDRDLNVINEVIMDPQWVRELIALNDGPLMLEGDEIFISSQPNQKMIDSFAHFNVPEMYPVKTYNDEKIFNILSYDFDTIPESLRETLFAESIIVGDQLGNREIMSIHSGKHNGVKVLNNHLGVQRFAGFGDGENDVTFLQSADFSVAMGNGCDGVKEVATFTTKTVLEDGIAHALKHFGVL